LFARLNGNLPFGFGQLRRFILPVQQNGVVD
jgi:hypothetical protein